MTSAFRGLVLVLLFAQVAAAQDLTLARVLALSRRACPDLRAAGARAAAADFLLARARKEIYPSLALNVNYQASNNALRKFTFLLAQNVLDPAQLFGAAPSVDNLTGQLHADYLIYNGGARAAEIRSAEAGSEAAAGSEEALRNRVMYQVAEAYYRLVQARELVGVRGESVELVRRELANVRAQIASNSAVQADALAVELKLSEVEEGLITAHTAAKLSRAVLENVIGARLQGEPPATLEAAPWAPHVAAIEAAARALEDGDGPAPLEAIAEAGRRRGELVEADGQRRAAAARLEVARAARSPTLGVSADLETNAGDLTAARATYFVGLAMSLKLFDFGRIRTDIRRAEADLAAALAAHERARLDVELDVRRALLSYQDARAKLAVTGASVNNSRENLSLVESRYRNQMITITQLFDAHVAVSDARVRAATARAELQIAAVGVERAIGRLAALSREVLGAP